MSIGSRLWHAVSGVLRRNTSNYSNGPAPTTKRCFVCRAEDAQSVNEFLVQLGGSILTMTINGWLCVDCSASAVIELYRRGSPRRGFTRLQLISKGNRGPSKPR